MKAVGIDPGVHTGFAVWDIEARKLLAVLSLSIHVALARVLEINRSGDLSHVVFEDARLRTYFGDSGRERWMGAGSVRRDSQIWAEALADAGITNRAVSPKDKGAKYSAEAFRRLTGWQEKTNEHGRDAAILIYGCTAMQRLAIEVAHGA